MPDGDYAAFIRRYAGKEFPPGAFVGTQGQVYGQHKGIIHYTVGQRKGLGLSFPSPCSSRSWTWKRTGWCSRRPRSCSRKK